MVLYFSHPSNFEICTINPSFFVLYTRIFSHGYCIIKHWQMALVHTTSWILFTSVCFCENLTTTTSMYTRRTWIFWRLFERRVEMPRAFGVFESYFQEYICHDIYLELESNRIERISNWVLLNLSNIFQPFKTIELKIFESIWTNFEQIHFLKIWLHIIVGVKLNESNSNWFSSNFSNIFCSFELME